MIPIRTPLIALMLSCICISAAQAAVSPEDFDALKKEIEALRGRSTQKVTAPVGRAEALTGDKYGPEAVVKTKDGLLTIGGLLQIWDYKIQNDNINFNGAAKGPNEINDNDSRRIRRAELKFSMKITPHITAVVMFDPTGGDEANTFSPIPSNQGLTGRGFFNGGTAGADQSGQEVEPPSPGAPFKPESRAGAPTGFGRTGGIDDTDFAAMQNGTARSNRLLQDAYINYYDESIIPHHDFTLGQFKPPASEEGNRNSGQLDFAERAMINQFSNQRDLGVMVHGTWFSDRLQYWIGAFDGAGSFQQTFAVNQNRSDDNDAKDLAERITGRPVWDAEKWYGRLEVGYSRQDGIHGESGRGQVGTPGATSWSVDGLSLQETHANRSYAWAWYRPGGPVRGWWLRGEWGSLTDRLPPGTGVYQGIQLAPRAFNRQGFYFATGYKLSESVWSDSLKDNKFFLWKMLHDVEFAYRYESFGNILTDDLTYLVNGNPVRTDVFKTNVHTAGINYYWKGYNVRTQLNYLFVDEPQGHAAFISPLTGGTIFTRRIREVKNNVFLVSQQIMW